jgi:hypothetical protein
MVKEIQDSCLKEKVLLKSGLCYSFDFILPFFWHAILQIYFK